MKNVCFIIIMLCVFSGCTSPRSFTKISRSHFNVAGPSTIKHIKDVVNDYQFDIQSVETYDDLIRIQAKHALGQTVRVDVVPQSDRSSLISVRVSNKGEKISSEDILSDLKVRLDF